MAWKVKCINCVNLKDDWCEKVIDSPCPDLERDCRHFRQKTNGDRIRAMSDEEFVDLAFKLNIDEQVNFCKMLPECEEILDRDEDLDLHKCKGCFMNWLKQPYKEYD